MPVAGDILVGPRGRYQIVAEHARGAFGTTFRAVRVGDALPLIVKALHLRGLPSWKALDLFEREAAVLRALSHARIPKWIDDLVLGPADAPTGFALVMELIPGRTLQEVARTGGLSPEEMMNWFSKTLEILAAIHARSPPIIHRDVNPKNLILRPGGEVALVDFGSVQAALRDAEAGETTAAGTFGYAPLEQFVGRATPSSDLYGLGMTYLAVATGRPPSELPMEGLRVNVRSALQADPRLVRLLEMMVEPDVRFRLRTADEALRALASLRDMPTVIADVPIAAATSGADTYLSRFHQRVARAAFTVTTGGELGRSPLVFTAHRPARGADRGEIQLFVARGEQVDGASSLQPLGPVPAALFVTACLSVPREIPTLWRMWVQRPAIIAPIIVCAQGLGPRTLGHVASTDREVPRALVVPMIVDLTNGAIEVIMPRMPDRADVREAIAEVRRLLPSAVGEDAQ